MTQSKVLAKVVLRRTEDGKILLLRRSKADIRRPGEWDLPGGRVEDGEDFTAAAVRETHEEAGIITERNSLSLAYALTQVTEHGNTSWLIYIGNTDHADVILSDEHDEFYWASQAEALEMVTYDRQQNALKHIFDNNLFD